MKNSTKWMSRLVRTDALFSQQSGFTLSAYLTQARMGRAAALLSDPSVRIADVAYAVGFEDPNYFSRVFRKFHGKPPSHFRAS